MINYLLAILLSVALLACGQTDSKYPEKVYLKNALKCTSSFLSQKKMLPKILNQLDTVNLDYYGTSIRLFVSDFDILNSYDEESYLFGACTVVRARAFKRVC